MAVQLIAQLVFTAVSAHTKLRQPANIDKHRQLGNNHYWFYVVVLCPVDWLLECSGVALATITKSQRRLIFFVHPQWLPIEIRIERKNQLQEARRAYSKVE